MQKFSLILAVMALITLSACENIEQFRAPIEEVAGTWAATTESVTEFATLLQSGQSSAASMMDKMVIPEGVDLGEEAAAQAAGFQSAAQEQVNTMQGLSATVSAFVGEWTEKAGILEGLQNGLAEGKLEGDVMAQVNELKEMIGTAKTNLTDWKGQMEAAKGGLQNAYDSFVGLLPQEEAAE